MHALKHSKKTQQVIEAPITKSRYLKLFCLSSYALTAIVIALLATGRPQLVLLWPILLMGYLLEQRLRKPMTHIVYAQKQLHWQTQNKYWHTAKVKSALLLGPYFIILRIQPVGRHLTRILIVPQDSMPADLHRKFRVILTVNN